MQSDANTPDEYVDQLPEERRKAISELRNVICENLPDGFEEIMQYGMIGYVVPLSTYPDGYHVSPGTPLPFIHVASQKNHIAVYHSGIYTDPVLMDWFVEAYNEQVTTKLNMGKSCIRFRNPKHIPYALIGELASKMSPQEWIEKYEKVKKRK